MTERVKVPDKVAVCAQEIADERDVSRKAAFLSVFQEAGHL